MTHTAWFLVALVALHTGYVDLGGLAIDVAIVMPLGEA